jgi:hypothetical protein
VFIVDRPGATVAASTTERKRISEPLTFSVLGIFPGLNPDSIVAIVSVVRPASIVV